MAEDLHEFDVALSFAGEDRQTAESLADGLREFGVRVFYDRYEQTALWGKDLYQHLQSVYRDKAKYCLIFVSQSYAKKVWTKHKQRQAQARAIAEEREYILPLRLDDTDLPGLNATVGYIDLRTNELAAVQDLLLRKLFGDDYSNADRAELTWRGELNPFRGSEVAAFWPGKLGSSDEANVSPYYRGASGPLWRGTGSASACQRYSLSRLFSNTWRVPRPWLRHGTMPSVS